MPYSRSQFAQGENPNYSYYYTPEAPPGKGKIYSLDSARDVFGTSDLRTLPDGSYIPSSNYDIALKYHQGYQGQQITQEKENASLAQSSRQTQSGNPQYPNPTTDPYAVQGKTNRLPGESIDSFVKRIDQDQSTGYQTSISSNQFSRQLDIGATGEDVKALQKFLNAQGFTISQSGAGSPGNETDYFGRLTQAALRKYQAAKGLDAVGRVGPKTLALLNSSLTTPSTPSTPSIPSTPSTPITSPSSPSATSPITGSSESERIKARIAAFKEGFGIGSPSAPPTLFSESDKTRLETARSDRDTLQNEEISILEDKMKLDEEFRKFKSQQVGMPEEGRIGAITEEGRHYQERADALNRRELIVETKLRNRNTVISELMNFQNQDYANAESQYNSKFNRSLQLYGIIDKYDNEAKTNAKVNLEVYSNSIASQIQAGQIRPDQITGIQKAKIEELETQAGFPIGSTMAILGTLKPTEEKLYSGVDSNGNFSYVTKDANNKITVRKLPGVAAPKKGTKGTRSSEESKILKNFEKDVTNKKALLIAKNREQFIRLLQARYPEIDSGDISRKVYEIYPSGSSEY